VSQDSVSQWLAAHVLNVSKHARFSSVELACFLHLLWLPRHRGFSGFGFSVIGSSVGGSSVGSSVGGNGSSVSTGGKSVGGPSISLYWAPGLWHNLKWSFLKHLSHFFSHVIFSFCFSLAFSAQADKIVSQDSVSQWLAAHVLNVSKHARFSSVELACFLHLLWLPRHRGFSGFGFSVIGSSVGGSSVGSSVGGNGSSVSTGGKSVGGPSISSNWAPFLWHICLRFSL